MRTSTVLLVGLFGLLFAAQGARADSLSVYVGYTDSVHSTPGANFPSLCSTFGPTCQVEQGAPLDGGVFRIDNNGPSPVTISDIQVTLDPTAGPIAFAGWSGVTIPAGGSATFGQTGYVLANGWPNFDTSDYPLFAPYGVLVNVPGIGINGIGGCTTPSALTPQQQAVCTANFPVISFDENGNPVTIGDSGSILNTGGYDLYASPGHPNESIDWQLAGSVTSTPEPGSLALIGTGILGLAGAIRRKPRG